MSKVSLPELGASRYRPNEAAERFVDRSTAVENVERVLNCLTKALTLHSEKACYVYGMGAHPRSTYQKISEKSGVELVLCRSVLPGAWKFFSPIIASYEGVIKINDPYKLTDVFLPLMKLAMVGVYIFDASLKVDFVERIRDGSGKKSYDFGITKDDGYIIYMVDGDSEESPTGYVEVINYGASAMWKDF